MPLSEVHGEYLESQVLTADPLELVRLLYRAAIEATRDAQVHLRAGRIGERASRVSKAHAIVTQLSLSLDHARGGTLSRSLAELYDYLQRRLIEANTRQRVEPLVEVEGLLLTLAEGWDKLRNADDALPGARPAGAGGFAEFGAYPAAVPCAPEAAYASQSWSF